ncbi:hypothetical protein AN639_07335 [Candidatus Epulonipiscium fishelsonii]|uniref:Uncharacterized protein n=1 Tax=Candidatus Epulonipiscium fishelsonii TaxID=77094 RepID=A0ACC8XA22_9FIRM|nr:hypothetical protein AN639_07335 [Epulopiscium sp. SCG-B05WGA-EpuloA1]ONI39062.1 hypothetical protein AN396_09320 [Epulopiscium sp. SCG-B11WGA-EpuloA1]ONI47541.1 hypothetical protein AN644_04870 [Epulopiscium sp. SCG-C06WGA-EpuloA1]
MQTIYIDVLFVINLIMDFYIFFVAKLLLNKPVKIKNLIVASTIASILYCLSIIWPFLQELPCNLYYFILPIISIIYLFEPITIKEFFKVYVINFFSAFIIGGLSFNIHYLVGGHFIVPIISGSIITFIIFISFESIRRKVLMLEYEANLDFRIENSLINLTGIIDTGNTLYTMFSKHPVIVVSLDKVNNYLNYEIQELVRNLETAKNIEEVLINRPRKVQLIPFESVGCKSGLLVGIEVKDLKIIKGNKTYLHKSSIIGLCSTPVFKDDKYSVLIHPDLIK